MTVWCEAWPDELKEAERCRYRAECKLRCLTAALDRTPPEAFDALMAQIEQAQRELQQAGALKSDILYKWLNAPKKG